jgi:hypothetical protein
MSHGSHGYDSRASKEQIIGKERQLILIAEGFDNLVDIITVC